MHTQIGDPHGIVDVRLAARNMFYATGIDDHRGDPGLLKDVEGRLPIGASALHSNHIAMVILQPFGHLDKIRRVCLEFAQCPFFRTLPLLQEAGNNFKFVYI